MVVLLIILFTYAISAYVNFKWTQKAHYHPNGRFNGIFPDKSDLWFTFMPFVNTVVMIFQIFESPYEKKSKEEEITIFKPKNYDRDRKS
jgi:hypothetical protein